MAVLRETEQRHCRLWTPDQGMDGICSKPFEPIKGKGRLGNLYFDDYLTYGTLLLIPGAYLYGRQERGDYENAKKRLVEARLRRCGRVCLEANPVVTCLVPFGNEQSKICAWDGHHRSKGAGKEGIDPVPSVVYTPKTLAYLLNRHKVDYPVKWTPEILINTLTVQMERAQKLWYEPSPVSARAIPDLMGMFQSFLIPEAARAESPSVLRELVANRR